MFREPIMKALMESGVLFSEKHYTTLRFDQSIYIKYSLQHYMDEVNKVSFYQIFLEVGFHTFISRCQSWTDTG